MHTAHSLVCSFVRLLAHQHNKPLLLLMLVLLNTTILLMMDVNMCAKGEKNDCDSHAHAARSGYCMYRVGWNKKNEIPVYFRFQLIWEIFLAPFCVCFLFLLFETWTNFFKFCIIQFIVLRHTILHLLRCK